MWSILQCTARKSVNRISSAKSLNGSLNTICKLACAVRTRRELCSFIIACDSVERLSCWGAPMINAKTNPRGITNECIPVISGLEFGDGSHGEDQAHGLG